MRVLLVDNDPERSRIVQASLREIGAEIVAVIGVDQDLRLATELHRPDLLLVDLTSPYRDYLEDLMNMNRETPRPVAMFVGEEDRDLMSRAVHAGVSLYAVDGLSPKLLVSVLETVLGQFRRYKQLQDELDGARAQLEERKRVERAKGLLMAYRGMTEEDAYSQLRRMAMDQNKRLSEVADMVIGMGDLLRTG
jgi:response regulator NasT